jgi:hypothetical protein
MASMENEATNKGEATSHVKVVDEYVDEYILELLKAGRAAAQDLCRDTEEHCGWVTINISSGHGRLRKCHTWRI